MIERYALFTTGHAIFILVVMTFLAFCIYGVGYMDKKLAKPKNELLEKCNKCGNEKQPSNELCYKCLYEDRFPK
jgi:hypothetical protein